MDKKRLLHAAKLFFKTVKPVYLGLAFFAAMLFLLLLLSAAFTSCHLAYADNKSLVDNKTIEELKERMNIAIDNESKEVARKLYDKYLTGEGLKEIEAFMARKAEELNVYDHKKRTEITPKGERGKVIIFISASVPKETLKSYVKQADGNTSFALRGAVGDNPSKFRPTLEFIRDLLCADPKNGSSCKNMAVTIDPLLFREYGVTRVPAILLLQGNNVYKFTGALPVSYVIEKAGL